MKQLEKILEQLMEEKCPGNVSHVRDVNQINEFFDNYFARAREEGRKKRQLVS